MNTRNQTPSEQGKAETFATAGAEGAASRPVFLQRHLENGATIVAA